MFKYAAIILLVVLLSLVFCILLPAIIYLGKWNKYRIGECFNTSSFDTILGWEEKIPFFTEKADI